MWAGQSGNEARLTETTRFVIPGRRHRASMRCGLHAYQVVTWTSAGATVANLPVTTAHVMKAALQTLALRVVSRRSASDTIFLTLDSPSSVMPSKTALIRLMLAALLVAPATSSADDFRSPGEKRWWQGEWKEEYWDGPCQVKSESKRGEFKREIKCKDGIGADWRGEWKDEYWDGPCLVKQDVKRDEFKEEVRCERG